MVEQVIEFELPLKISTNKIYSGVHWSTRQKHKNIYHWDLIAFKSQIKPIKSCDLEFEFNFKSKPLDCDNCGYMAKLIIDTLRYYDKIPDDSPEYVKSIKISSKKSNKNNVLLKIYG